MVVVVGCPPSENLELDETSRWIPVAQQESHLHKLSLPMVFLLQRQYERNPDLHSNQLDGSGYYLPYFPSQKLRRLQHASITSTSH